MQRATPEGLVELTQEEEAELMAQRQAAVAEKIIHKRNTATLTPMQFRLALLNAGLLDNAEVIVADNATPREIKIMWEYASSFDRMNPELLQFAAALGLTEQQIDAVFGIQI